MSLIVTIRENRNAALKAHDDVKVSTLRFLISKLDNAKIQKGGELTDVEVLLEIAKDVKRHKESAEAFKTAGREELYTKEEAEQRVLAQYLPQQMGADEVEKIVEGVISQTGAVAISDMGRVMSAVIGKVGQGADGSTIAKIVREKLSK